MTWRLTAALVGTAAACCASPALGAPEQESDSGVRGHVKVGPTCPAEQPGPGCQPRGYKTVIRVRTLPDHEFVKDVHTGPHGGFRTSLPPGHYRLQPRSGDPFPSCGPRKVTVNAGAFKHVELVCDSGIR